MAEGNQGVIRDSEELFNRALELRNQGDLKQAEALLLVFQDLNPGASIHLIPLAEVLMDQGLLMQALPCLQEHTRLKPQNWIGSVGLFHCLLTLDRFSEAIEEAERFRKVFVARKESYSENAQIEIEDYLKDAAELRNALKEP